MPSAPHSECSVAGRHPLHGVAVFADITARNAHTYSSLDEGKVVRVTSPASYWLITSVSAGVGTFVEWFTPAYYYGYNTAGITYSSTVWSGVHNVTTLTDVNQTGITRSGSDFTFAKAGKYLLNATFAVQGNASYAVAFRLRDVAGASTKSSGFLSLGASTIANVALSAVVTVTAGQVLAMQYCKSATGTAPAMAGITHDTEAIRNVEISFTRIE
jgi:hypothetical protein